jgi:hypothetical protein
VAVSSSSVGMCSSSSDMTIFKSRYDINASLSDRSPQVGPTIKFNQNTSKTNTQTATLVNRIRVWCESSDDDVNTDVDIVIKKNYKENALASSPSILWPSFWK